MRLRGPTRALVMLGALGVLGVLGPLSTRAHAHPMEFGVMSLDEQRDGRFEFELRFSGGEDSPMAGAPWLDGGCTAEDPIDVPLDWGVHLRGMIRCENGIVGKRIGVVGLAGTEIEVPLTIRFRNGDVQSAVLGGNAPRYRVAARPSRFGVLRSYVVLGVEHITAGIDHLLLVLGLVLASRGLRDVALTITSFTLGHSVTLVLASLGVLDVPGPPVEACIALSLVLLAIELVRKAEPARYAEGAEPDQKLSRPFLLAVVFGLLHGLGFAGALAEVGLPRSAIGVALFGFNVGVELGQLAFVAVVLTVVAVARRIMTAGSRAFVARHVPELVGAAAVYFLLDRLGNLGG